MEDTDGGLHSAVDGQSLDEDEDEDDCHPLVSEAGNTVIHVCIACRPGPKLGPE